MATRVGKGAGATADKQGQNPPPGGDLQPGEIPVVVTEMGGPRPAADHLGGIVEAAEQELRVEVEILAPTVAGQIRRKDRAQPPGIRPGRCLFEAEPLPEEKRKGVIR